MYMSSIIYFCFLLGIYKFCEVICCEFFIIDFILLNL